jgi:predicted ATPase
VTPQLLSAELSVPDPGEDFPFSVPAIRSLGEMEQRYGKDPDARSHGEGFLHLFQSRLVPRGLYLLDEPEAALSPQSQLAFLSMLKASIDEGSQFVIATHSPILMAVPDAVILSFDTEPVGPVAFEDLEHVSLLRDFLANPEGFLRHLWI